MLFEQLYRNRAAQTVVCGLLLFAHQLSSAVVLQAQEQDDPANYNEKAMALYADAAISRPTVLWIWRSKVGNATWKKIPKRTVCHEGSSLPRRLLHAAGQA